MDWIIEHWDFIVEVLAIAAGAALAIYKNYQKWQESGQENFISWVAGIVVAELRRLAEVAREELDEDYVKAKAAELWQAFGGDPAHAEEFAAFVWFLWSGLVDSSDRDAERGMIAHSATYRGQMSGGGEPIFTP